MNSSSSPTAAMVTASSNAAACLTPQMFTPVNTTYAAMAITLIGTAGKYSWK